MVFYCGTGSGSTGSGSTGSGSTGTGSTGSESTGSGSTGPSLGWFYHRFRDLPHSHFQKRFNLKWKMPIKVFFSFKSNLVGMELSLLWRESPQYSIFALSCIRTNEPSERFLSASSHLWNGLVPDLPAAPEMLTSRSLLPRDDNGDGWNKWKEVEAETGP